MSSIKRVLLSGAIFAIGLPFGFFLSQTVYDSELLIPSGILVGEMTMMWLGAAIVFLVRRMRHINSGDNDRKKLRVYV